MPNQYLPTHIRLTLTLLTCILAWSGLERISLAANLTVSDPVPRVFFDDTDTIVDPDWQILADSVAFNLFSSAGTDPFNITAGAPDNSIKVDSAGHVGLGTAFPFRTLHLVSGFGPAIRFEQNTSLNLTPYTWELFADNFFFFLVDVSQSTTPIVVESGGAPNFSLFIAKSGKIGLGTANPQGNLHISGAADKDIFNGIGPDLTNGPAFNFGYAGHSFGAGRGFFNVRGTTSGVNPSLRFATVNVQRMIITNAGKVGIGTLAPTQQLDVAGNVRANGFIAGSTTLAVPDYVFEPHYQLMALRDLQTYVEKEHHLPDVPSAQAIKEQGVNMSELQMQLLKKVEELTLYTLRQEGKVREQEKVMQRQEHAIRELRAALADLQAIKPRRVKREQRYSRASLR